MATQQTFNFRQFILDATDDSIKAEAEDKRKLIRGLYAIVSKKKYDNMEIEKFLAKHGYVITAKELRSLRNLHVATDYFFEVHDKDY